MLPPRRLGMARRAGPRAPFHSVLGQAGEGIFFVSISDYYLTIIRTFSVEANYPGQQLEHPSSTGGQHDNPPARPAIRRLYPGPPCVQLFFTHLRIISLLSAYGMVMFCAWDAHEGILLLYKTPIIRIFFGD